MKKTLFALGIMALTGTNAIAQERDLSAENFVLRDDNGYTLTLSSPIGMASNGTFTFPMPGTGTGEITMMGNVFNGANQLVQLGSSSELTLPGTLTLSSVDPAVIFPANVTTYFRDSDGDLKMTWNDNPAGMDVFVEGNVRGGDAQFNNYQDKLNTYVYINSLGQASFKDLTITDDGTVRVSTNVAPAGPTIDLTGHTSSVIRITDDAAADANVVTMPFGSEGELLYILNGDAEALTGAVSIAPGAAQHFVNSDGLWWPL
jgi:hypothetical protein